MRSSVTWIPTSTPRHCEMWPPSLEFPRPWEDNTGGEKKVTVEAHFVKFVVEHNLSFRSAEHFSKLVKMMFPDTGRLPLIRTSNCQALTSNYPELLIIQMQPHALICMSKCLKSHAEYFCTFLFASTKHRWSYRSCTTDHQQTGSTQNHFDIFIF